MKLPSICGLVRKSMKINGKTVTARNGRLRFMKHSLSTDEIMQRLISVAETWRKDGILYKDIQIEGTCAIVQFQHNLVRGGYLTTLYLDRGELMVGC
ncbi:hypothetical protein UFOVP29_158 [uncultured Caudovirales phage]|uniref:Uncharacterized protein n=1 Tax=uncultured Caudovirales phage TaxID=2100421 RepID=A0A6J5KRY5_9CAUD|nr:hypothetical protein UFOVP29_158 [uncultured Caudovirales phage]